MTSNTLPPGAWLSGTAPGGAALWPEPPGGVPTSAGLWPEPPGGVPNNAMLWPEPPAGGPPWGTTRPWQGINPAWVRASSDAALRAQALRHVRTRIVQPQDPRVAPAPSGQLPPTPDTQALWRWQRAFRLKAVEAELLARVVVQGREVWWVPPPAALCATPPQTPSLSFRLTAPDEAAQPFNYEAQIDMVLRATVEREERLPEILSQSGDIGVFFDALTGIDRNNAPRLSELLDAAWEVTTQVLMALKHQVAEWRPVQRATAVVPVIDTPGHGSLPSGHAAMAAVAAGLLNALLYAPGSPRALQLDRLARRIAFNRVVAGVHFQMDSRAGYHLGHHLAQLLVAAATGAALPAALTHTVHEEDELAEDGEGPPAAAPAAAARATRVAPLLAQLWDAAVREVALRRV